MTLTLKINRLYQLLVLEKDVFEQVANQVTDSTLRYTVRSLAQQSNQYAAELCAYLQSSRTTVQYATTTTSKSKTVFPGEKDVLQFCNSNERKLVTAYRKIIKESASHTNLQKMLDYQLNGVLTTSMQLKLLKSLRPHKTTGIYAAIPE